MKRSEDTDGSDERTPNGLDSGGDSETKLDSVEDILRSDGGTVDSPFERTATVEETRRDRIDRKLKDYLWTPWSIMRNDWRAIVGVSILVVYLLIGTVGVYLIEPTHPTHGESLVGPFEDWSHPLGTDQSGQDILSMTVYSTVPILQMMGAGALFTIVLGTGFGLVSGYKGGMVDTVLSSITDVFINIPGLPLVIVLSVLLEPEHPALVGILLAAAAWAGLARAIRSQVLTLRGEAFVEASRAMDVPTVSLLRKEILPHLMPYIVVNLVNAARRIIFAAVALYFLGILPYSDANWGVMLESAYRAGAVYRPDAIHWLVVPMIAISGISIGLVLLGQSLDRVFNPRARARHERSDDGKGSEPESEPNTTNVTQM
ncbi:ABC transporter permease [Halostagnicola bangensis]